MTYAFGRLPSSEAPVNEGGRPVDDIVGLASRTDCCFSTGISALLSLTDACNQSCLHCMRSALLGRGQLADIDNVFARAEQVIRQTHADRLVISGGEPTLVPNLAEAIEALSVLPVQIGLCTNALKLTPNLAERLHEAGLARCTVGFEGVGEIYERFRGSPGGFNRALRGLDAAIDARLPTTVNVTLWNNVLDQVDEVSSVFGSRALHAITFTVPMVSGRASANVGKFSHITEESVRNFVQEVAARVAAPVHLRIPRCDQASCPSGRSVFSVGPNGETKACPDVGALSALDLVRGDMSKDVNLG